MRWRKDPPADAGPRKLRMVIVAPYFPPERTGCAARMSGLAENLAGDGVEVTVLAPHPTFPTGTYPRRWRRKEETWHGNVRVIHLWAWQPQASDPGFLSRAAYYLTFPLHAMMWAMANLRRYDVVVTAMPPVFTGLAGLAVKGVHRDKGFVADVGDLWIDAAVDMGFTREESFMTRWSRRFEARCYRRADVVSVATRRIAERLHERYELDDTRVVVTPNGSDTVRFRPADADREPRFVYAGGFGHAQDLDTMVRAFHIAHATHPEARLVLAGDGENRQALERLTRDLGIEDAVEFTGMLPREEVPQLCATSLAGLAPVRNLASLEYAVPTKTYEYMACGIPFIGTGGSELARLADESGAGLVPDGTPEAVAEAMNRLLDDRAKAKEMGVRGRTYVHEHYDWGTIARRLLQAIQQERT